MEIKNKERDKHDLDGFIRDVLLMILHILRSSSERYLLSESILVILNTYFKCVSTYYEGIDNNPYLRSVFSFCLGCGFGDCYIEDEYKLIDAELEKMHEAFKANRISVEQVVNKVLELLNEFWPYACKNYYLFEILYLACERSRFEVDCTDYEQLVRAFAMLSTGN